MEEKELRVTITLESLMRLCASDTKLNAIKNAFDTCDYDSDFRKFVKAILEVKPKEESNV